MDMKIFNEKLFNEDYPLILPPWLILGGQVISGAFILTKITLTVWFCLKHRKSMTTLLKIALPLKENYRMTLRPLSIWFNELVK